MKHILLCLLIVFASCATSNMSKNTTQEGVFFLKGGKQSNKSWDTNLVFKRYSWYKELSMLFDLNIAKLEKDSPFVSWLSEKEKADLMSCEEFYVVISYALDSERLSTSTFLDQMKANGYIKTPIHSFFSFLKLHPDYESSTLQLYDVYGFCSQKKVPLEQIAIEFPSFSPVTLK